jgi:hypothetical protein
MTYLIPSLMTWPSTKVQTVASQPGRNDESLRPAGVTKPDLPLTGSDHPSPKWPRWAQLSLFMSLLLGGALLMIWAIRMAYSHW